MSTSRSGAKRSCRGFDAGRTAHAGRGPTNPRSSPHGAGNRGLQPKEGGYAMRKAQRLVGTALIAMAAATPAALAQETPGKGVTIYMQMGGNPGDGATLARQTGANAAAKGLGVDRLNEQFSAWAPEKMIEQFKQAMAAKPSCIVIMGHPGNEAFADLVKQAADQGIVVTDGNAPLSELQKAHGPQDFR